MENKASVSKTRKGRKQTMKKILFNLQLFAEGDPANNTDPVADPNTDPKEEPKGEPGTDPKPDDKSDEKKYTDAEFDKKLNQKFAEWQKKKEAEIAEAEKLAKMSAEEKANHTAQKEKERADKAEARIAELERKDALSEMSKTARKMLADEGINISDELLSRLVTTDAEETKAAVDGFAKLFKTAVEDAVKEQARGTTPRNITNNAGDVSEIDKRIKKYE